MAKTGKVAEVKKVQAAQIAQDRFSSLSDAITRLNHIIVALDELDSRLSSQPVSVIEERFHFSSVKEMLDSEEVFHSFTNEVLDRIENIKSMFF